MVHPWVELRLEPFSWTPWTSAAEVGAETREQRRVCLIVKHVVLLWAAAARLKHKGEGRRFTGRRVGVRRPGGRQRSCLLCLTLGRSELWGRRAWEQMESKRRTWGRRTGDLLTPASVSVPPPLLRRSAIACGPNALPFIVRTVCTRLRCRECRSRLVGFI